MSPARANGPEPHDERLERLLAELDRLEDLLEEMDELGVATRDEVDRRLAELIARVDELTGG